MIESCILATDLEQHFRHRDQISEYALNVTLNPGSQKKYCNQEEQFLSDPVVGLQPFILDKFVEKLELLETKFAGGGCNDAVDIILHILSLKYKTVRINM